MQIIESRPIVFIPFLFQVLRSVGLFSLRLKGFPEPTPVGGSSMDLNGWYPAASYLACSVCLCLGQLVRSYFCP